MPSDLTERITEAVLNQHAIYTATPGEDFEDFSDWPDEVAAAAVILRPIIEAAEAMRASGSVVTTQRGELIPLSPAQAYDAATASYRGEGE